MSKQLTKAETLAGLAHSGQFRRDGVTPYIEHPTAVASRCAGEKPKIVAWLHDVLEDTNVKRCDLVDMGFDEDIIIALELLTHDKEVSYADYLHKLKGNTLARQVKLMDMVSNLFDDPTARQVRKYAEGLTVLLGYEARLHQGDEV